VNDGRPYEFIENLWAVDREMVGSSSSLSHVHLDIQYIRIMKIWVVYMVVGKHKVVKSSSKQSIGQPKFSTPHCQPPARNLGSVDQ
jgi:hypothetical protein